MINTLPKHRDDRVLIIDGLNTFMRVFSSISNISHNGEFVGGILGMLRSIGVNIRQFNPTRCIIVFDGKGGSHRRRKIYPEYKGTRNRSTGMRNDIFKSVDEEKQAMRMNLIRTVEYLSQLPVEILTFDNIEADDTIAYITSTIFKNKSQIVRIVSTDRDFLQLISHNIEVYSPVKKKLYTEETLQDEFTLTSDEYLMYRVISGDTSDNIPGIPGIGLKTFLKSFKHKSSIDQLMTECTDRINSKQSIYRKVIEHKDCIARNYELMQLHDVDISAATKLKLFELIESPMTGKPYRVYEIKRMLVDDGIIDSFKNLDQWLLETFSTLNVWIDATKR